MDPQKEKEEWMLIRKDGEAYLLPRSMIFVGREECDVILLTPSVDKRHAVIFFDTSSKQYHVKDLNSTCGTYLNGVRIPEQSYVKLSHMDNIRFGFGPEMFLACRSLESPGSQSPLPKQQAEKSEPVNVENVSISDEPPNELISSTEAKPANDQEKKEQETLMAVDSLEDIRSNGDDSVQDSLSDATTVKPSLSAISESPKQGVSKATPSPASSVASSSPKEHASKLRRKSEVLYISEEKEVPKLRMGSSFEGRTKESEESVTSSSSPSAISSSTTSLPEKGNIPSPSTPASMAFTIAFDNNLPVSKKKLGIRDSLSKFAPPKAMESERSVQRSRPANKDASDHKAAFSEKSPVASRKKYTSAKESKASSSAKHETKEKEAAPTANGQLSDSASYLIRRMLYNDRSPEGSSSPESRQGSGSSSAKLPQAHSSGFSGTSTAQTSYNKVPPDKSGKATKQQEVPKASLSPSGDRDLVGGDDRSETGTYTVDNDQLDPAVEEARKKIDEVFGVLEKVNNCPQNKMGHDSGSSGANRMGSHNSFWLQGDQDSGTSERKEVRHLPPQGLRVQAPFILHDSEGDSKGERGLMGTATFTRPKRRLPTPPSEKAPTELSVYNPPSSESHPYSAASLAATKGKQSSQDNPADSPQHFFLGPFSPTFSSDSSKTGSSKGVPNVLKHKRTDHSATTTNRTDKATSPHPPRGLPLVPHRQSEAPMLSGSAAQSSSSESAGMPPTPGSAKSESNANPPRKGSSGSQWPKASWNLSTSDLELNKCETSSVKSENSTSTEPSSQSSHSGKSKGETAPQMRLNRAFALRRARLGIDAPSSAPAGKGVAGGKDGKQPSSSNTSPYSSNSSLAKTPTSNSPVLTPGSLVRQDGGRFSLRLPRNVGKSSALMKGDSSKNSKEDLSKLKHRRNDSDPGRPVTRITSFRGTNHSDSEQQQSNLMTTSMICTSSSQPASIQRSASFSSTDGLGLQEEKRTATNGNNNPFKVPRHMLALKTHPSNKSDHKSNVAKERQGAKSAAAGQFVAASEKAMSTSHTDMRNAKSQSQLQSTKKELTALDSLVVSAIYQLSQKLRGSARAVLEKERLKHAQGSDVRLMIDEVLPQMADKRPSSEGASEGNLSRDLSNILKNLKKVEQSLEVVFLLMDPENRPPAAEQQNKDTPQRSNFFIVDV